ncbi:MAG: hypothetical protein E6771_15070 [Fusobacterium sp.]|nr:hypothetical protein [Fusobacterium sp.]MDU1912516.1 hypothetical protein [Fusobacterium sp.]
MLSCYENGLIEINIKLLIKFCLSLEIDFLKLMKEVYEFYKND